MALDDLNEMIRPRGAEIMESFNQSNPVPDGVNEDVINDSLSSVRAMLGVESRQPGPAA